MKTQIDPDYILSLSDDTIQGMMAREYHELRVRNNIIARHEDAAFMKGDTLRLTKLQNEKRHNVRKMLVAKQRYHNPELYRNHLLSKYHVETRSNKA